MKKIFMGTPGGNGVAKDLARCFAALPNYAPGHLPSN